MRLTESRYFYHESSLCNNGAAVGIFGMVLSGAFCDIHWTKEKREFLVGSIFVLLAIQGVMYLLAGAATIRYLYPVITHVPMCIALYILTKNVCGQ